MIAPTLHTARLVLRPLSLTDFPAYQVFMASPSTLYMGGPYDMKVAWGIFCHDAGLWALAGHGALMINTQAGDTVGVVGINAGPLFPEPELGWMLYQGCEGHGYATEAAAALRDWGFAVRGLATMVSYIDPNNHASVRVAERLGAVSDSLAPRQPGDETDLVYRHARAA
jgi:RimJ/RimL family protein N-acetyltransferase